MVVWLSNLFTSPIFIIVTSTATVVGLIATIVSLRLALRSISDGKKFVRGLSAVQKSLTTRRVGESPEYGGVVARLVRQAKQSVQITQTFPVIGIYSGPEIWLELEHALMGCQARNVPVYLLVGSRSARKEALEIQFADCGGANWKQWADRPENSKKLAFFAKRYGYANAVFDTSVQFIEFCLDVQDQVIKQVFYDARKEVTDAFIPLPCWIRDDTEAVFAIANSRGRNTGFVTRDQHLISSFKELRGRYPRV
jgi:hypothetical protein